LVALGLLVTLEAKSGKEDDPVAAALMETAPELLASELVIETLDVLADKLPS